MNQQSNKSLSISSALVRQLTIVRSVRLSSTTEGGNEFDLTLEKLHEKSRFLDKFNADPSVKALL